MSDAMDIMGSEMRRAAWSAPARRSAQQAFAQTLGKHADTPDVPRSPAQQARDAAEGLVSQTFVQPMLKLFRDSNRAAPPFAPTPAEKQFRSLMDVQLAQQIVSAKQFPIVDAIADHLIKHGSKDGAGRDAMRELRENSALAGAGRATEPNTAARITPRNP